MSRRLIPVTVAAVAALLVPAGAVSAHDRAITADCEGVSVELTEYSADPNNTNTVRIWIDGISVEGPTTFGSSFSWSTTFADSTISHTYRVAVTATMFPEGTFDTGEQVIDACAAPTTTTTIAPTTTTTTIAPTTTAGTTTTTTLAAATSSTTTTLLATAGPIPTTTLVSPAAGALPAPASPASAALPATGADHNEIALAALGAALLGGLLIAVAVRSRPSA